MTVERNDESVSEDHPCTTYRYERDLVADFVQSLRVFGLFGIQELALEFDYQRGRTDIVAVSTEGHVIAFEAKLSDWRTAMHQAYRNTCFAAESYILMPLAAAQRAASHVREFELRGVGICGFFRDSVEVLQRADRRPVVEPWLTKRAAAFASSSSQA